MLPDVGSLLRDAAPVCATGLDPDEVWTIGRYRRRRRKIARGLAGIAIAGVVVIGAAWFTRPGPDLTVTAGDIVTIEDPVQDFTVQLPTRWHRASTTLTPNLGNPVEILSLGTADLPAGGSTCAQFPVAALEAMSPTDAFITVQERHGDGRFAPRPGRLPPDGSTNDGDVTSGCLAGPAVFDEWWFSFEENGRNFHVLVAIGTDASPGTRAETWRILDSLRFDS